MQCAPDELAIYQIRVSDELDPCWSEWLDNMNVVPQRTGETVLVGLVMVINMLQTLLASTDGHPEFAVRTVCPA